MNRVLPILFNADMVLAILDGRKTVTRRCVKFLPGENPNWTGYIKDGLILYNGRNEPCCRKAPYQLGDYIYVRETWNKLPFTGKYIYKADDTGSDVIPDGVIGHLKYKPSIHMPKEAARIWLKVTDVRVERLQDMTYMDFMRERITVETHGVGVQNIAEQKFRKLWNSTIKKHDLDRYGWDTNPWVWRIEFERCEKPEEEK